MTTLYFSLKGSLRHLEGPDFVLIENLYVFRHLRLIVDGSE